MTMQKTAWPSATSPSSTAVAPSSATPESGGASSPLWPQDPRGFLEAIMGLSLRCVGITDDQGIIRYSSSVCQNIYGVKPEEIVGRHFRELYDDPQALNEMLAQARSQGRIDNFPIMARDNQGRAVPTEVSLVRIHDADRRLIGSGAMIHDRRQPEDLVLQLQQQELVLVRLNRQMELANLELARANRLKDEFLANTSHELRTPLNSVLGFLRLVLDKLCDNPAEEREFIQHAYDSAKNLLNLINELLDTAKIEAGKVELDLVEVNTSQVFERVKQLSQVQAAQKGLRLIFRLPRTEVLVRADAGKLDQVLLNLVANAIKFTHQGEILVTARALRAKGHVRFEIRDTGIGIPLELQQDVFQKFVQGNGSSTRQYSGSGLGLAICKNLVEFMGGQIWLSSPGPEQGTTVSFTLPLVFRGPFHWRRLEDRERGLQVRGLGDGPLILVVEDEPKVVEVMTRILNKGGYRTTYAVTADDGLEGARRLDPALITIDMGLPVRPQASLHSGLDLCAALQREPRTTGIPLILVTGHDISMNRRVKELPPTLTKPFRARELLNKVGELLDASKRLLSRNHRA